MDDGREESGSFGMALSSAAITSRPRSSVQSMRDNYVGQIADRLRISQMADGSESEAETHLRELLAEMQSEMITAKQACRILGMPRSTLGSYRAKYHFGVVIGRKVFYRKEEILEIAARSYRVGDRALKISRPNPAGKLERRIKSELWMRPEVLSECLRQAKSQKISAEDYLQLLVYMQAPRKWQRALNPPLEFVRGGS